MGDGNQFMGMVELPKGAIVELELSIGIKCDRKCYQRPSKSNKMTNIYIAATNVMTLVA